MTAETSSTSTLSQARELAATAQRLADAAITRGRELTGAGADIDEHQVLCERLAQIATEARAAQALVDYAERLSASAKLDDPRRVFRDRATRRSHGDGTIFHADRRDDGQAIQIRPADDDRSE